MRTGTKASRQVALTDAGGGAGEWQVSVALQARPTGVTVVTPASLTGPGTLSVDSTVGAAAAEADVTGFVVLTRGTDTRRIPFWLRVESPKLAAPTRTLAKPGTYVGDTRKGKAQVSSYRYPDAPGRLGRGERSPRSGTGLSGSDQRSRRQLRRPHRQAGPWGRGNGQSGRRRGREPPGGLPSPSSGHQSVSRDLRRPRPRRRCDRTGTRALRPRLRHRVSRTRRAVHVSLLAQRHESTESAARHGLHGPHRDAHRRRFRHRLRSRPEDVDRDPRRSRHTRDLQVRSGDRAARRPARERAAHARPFRLRLPGDEELENVGPILPNTRVLRTQFTVR